MPEINASNAGDVFACAAAIARQQRGTLALKLYRAAVRAYKQEGDYERAGDLEASRGRHDSAGRLYRSAVSRYARNGNLDRAAHLAVRTGDQRAAAYLRGLRRRYEAAGCPESAAYVSAELEQFDKEGLP